MNTPLHSPAPLGWLRFIPAIIWWLLSYGLLTLPGSKVPAYPWMEMLQVDKWVHIFLFAVLCCLFIWPFRYTTLSPANRLKWFWLIAILAACYGIAMEFVQKYYVLNRAFELGDILADIAGCALALWLGKKYALQ
jgi:VanZ family protein